MENGIPVAVLPRLMKAMREAKESVDVRRAEGGEDDWADLLHMRAERVLDRGSPPRPSSPVGPLIELAAWALTWAAAEIAQGNGG
jgi:hypothetical protein